MQSTTITSDKNTRLNYKEKLLRKVELSLTPNIPELMVEPAKIEIIEKYASQPLAGTQRGTRLFRQIDPEEYETPGAIEKLAFSPEGDLPKRVSFKQKLYNRIVETTSIKLEPETAKVEIVESYSPWRYFEPIETIPLGIKEEKKGFILDRDISNRTAFKDNLALKLAKSLNPVVEVESEPVKVEIIEKYAKGLFRHIDPMDTFDPETKEEKKDFILTSDILHRLEFKDALINKVEETLTIPVPEYKAPIEIIEGYVPGIKLSTSLEAPILISPEEPFILDSDVQKRIDLKDSISHKIEQTLTPSVQPISSPIEIIESYSPWRSFEPIETIPLGIKKEQDRGFITPGDIPKRKTFKDSLVQQVEEVLASKVSDTESQPIEIIESYSPWRSFEPIETIPLGIEKEQDLGFITPGDIPKRKTFKDSLVQQVEEILSPKVPDNGSRSIEIIESYSPWRSFDSIETTPITKDEIGDFILDSDSPKRLAFKDTLISKVEEILTPIPEVELAPIEILEKYAQGLQSPLLIEPMDELLPEFKKESSFIPNREISKRQDLKLQLLQRVKSSLVPIEHEVLEPVKIEIIEKYAQGIPMQIVDMDISELPIEDIKTFILDSDVSKRQIHKEKLLRKLGSSSIEKSETQPIEILDYSQRSISPLGIEFEKVEFSPIIETSTKAVDQEVTYPSIKELLIPVLRLPYNYKDFDEKTLYGILTRTPALQHTSQTANLTLDILNGRSAQEVDFQIMTVDKINSIKTPIKSLVAKKIEIQDQFKVQDKEKRLAFAKALSDKTEKISVITQETIIESAGIKLPEDWQNRPLYVLRTDLLNGGATPEQVDNLLLSLMDNSHIQQVERSSQSINESINLPDNFTTWKSNSQYLYLTKELKLTPELANETIYNLIHK